jgi:hypothetical protein
MSDRPTPETDNQIFEAWDDEGHYIAWAVDADFARRLERERDELLKALESLTHHRPIMGSTGDYREGQAHILESVTRIAKAAIAAAKGGEG